MINLKNQDQAASNALMILAVVTMLGTFGFLLLPKPTTKGLATKYQRDRMDALIATKKAKVSATSLDAKVTERVWGGNVADVGPAALAKVTAVAGRHSVRLVAFRPQRTADAGPLPQLPFLVNIEGSFPNVMAFERDLEQPANKLAITMLQIASSDSTTDQVTASVGLVAYLSAPKKDDGKAESKPAARRSVSKEEANGTS